MAHEPPANLNGPYFRLNSIAETNYVPLPTNGEQKLLVLVFNYKDRPDDKPYTIAQINDMVFGQTNSLNAYYRENSKNATWISGITLGWYTTPYTSGPCEAYNASLVALEMARNEGVDVDSFPRRLFLFPENSGCGIGGWAGIGGNPSYAFSSLGNNVETDRHLMAHEFGHNLTFGHANSLDCADQIVKANYNTACEKQYYNDWYGVMGGGGPAELRNLFQLNGMQKAHLGWENRVQEISTNGTYTLSPFEAIGIGTAIYKIRKYDTQEFYFLEYRQPLAGTFDARLPSGITRGALIRIGQYLPYYYNSTEIIYPESFLLDTSPNSILSYDDITDAALRDGYSFVDSTNNISVAQVTHNASGATLNVAVQPGFRADNLRTILENYLRPNDTFYAPVDGKINSMDFTFINSQLAN